jgi:hypothetical protein
VNAADTVMFQLRSTTTATRLEIFQIVVGVQSAPSNAPVFYLTRASANGTSSTTLAGQIMDSADPAAAGTLDSAWSVAPTVTPANKIQVGPMAVTAGGGWVWTFPSDAPLRLATSTTAGGLAVVNAVASGTTLGSFTCSVLWRE